MSFGEVLLKKLGWKEGQGLGLKETGIKTAVRPKLKFDTAGFGCNKYEDLTSQWPDHVYNKTAKNISVEKTETGKMKGEEIRLVTKKPYKDRVKKDLYYGNFMKGSVLHGSEEIPETNSSTVEDSTEEENHELIQSFSDDELFRRCGGLTAHKGARHGFTMSAKLARLQQQEEAFMSGRVNSSQDSVDAHQSKRKKAPKEKLKADQGGIQAIIADTPVHLDASQSEETSGKRKKKKRKDRIEERADEHNSDRNTSIIPSENHVSPDSGDGMEPEIEHKVKKKKKNIIY